MEIKLGHLHVQKNRKAKERRILPKLLKTKVRKSQKPNPLLLIFSEATDLLVVRKLFPGEIFNILLKSNKTKKPNKLSILDPNGLNTIFWLTVFFQDLHIGSPNKQIFCLQHF